MNMKQQKLSSHLNPLKNKKETVSPILRSLGNVFHLAVVYRAFRQVSRFARRRHVVFYLALFFFPAAFLTFVDLHFVLGVHVVPKGLFKRLEEPVAHQVFVTLHDTTHVRRVSWEFKVCVRFEGGGFSLFSAFNQSVARSTHTHQHKRKSKHSRVISFLCFSFCFYLLFTLATPLRDVLSFCVVLLPPKSCCAYSLGFSTPLPSSSRVRHSASRPSPNSFLYLFPLLPPDS